jgi:hypothetical protein
MSKEIKEKISEFLDVFSSNNKKKEFRRIEVE